MRVRVKAIQPDSLSLSPTTHAACTRNMHTHVHDEMSALVCTMACAAMASWQMRRCAWWRWRLMRPGVAVLQQERRDGQLRKRDGRCYWIFRRVSVQNWHVVFGGCLRPASSAPEECARTHTHHTHHHPHHQQIHVHVRAMVSWNSAPPTPPPHTHTLPTKPTRLPC